MNRVCKLLSIIAFLGACPAVAAEMAREAPAQQAERQPLLIIRFEQPDVNYTRALKQAIAHAEGVKPGVVYDVLSVLPAAKDEPDASLKGVIAAMQQLGVPAERIATATLASTSVKTPEIKIYVR